MLKKHVKNLIRLVYEKSENDSKYFFVVVTVTSIS